MLLNEHKKIEEQSSNIQKLQSALTQQAAQMQELIARVVAKGL
jgi:hypothetical protein